MARPTNDADIEMMIDAAFNRMLSETIIVDKRNALADMSILLKLRSPNRVIEMEIEQGIAQIKNCGCAKSNIFEVD